MTNREKILKTNPYDFLCEINHNIRSMDQGRCIGTGLLIEKCLAKNCAECLRLWMDKEYKTDIPKNPQIIWLVYTDSFFYGAYSSITKALAAIRNYVYQDIEDENLAESIMAELQARSEQTPEEFHYESYITVESTVVDEGIE